MRIKKVKKLFMASQHTEFGTYVSMGVTMAEAWRGLIELIYEDFK